MTEAPADDVRPVVRADMPRDLMLASKTRKERMHDIPGRDDG